MFQLYSTRRSGDDDPSKYTTRLFPVMIVITLHSLTRSLGVPQYRSVIPDIVLGLLACERGIDSSLGDFDHVGHGGLPLFQ